MQVESIAVVIQTKEGKAYQVALNNEQCEVLLCDLKMYFDGGVIKVLETPLDLVIEKPAQLRDHLTEALDKQS